MVHLMSISDEMKPHNVISRFADFKKFCTPRKMTIRDEFLNNGFQTRECKRVTALLTTDEDLLYFAADTTLYCNEYIKKRLEEEA